MKLKKLFIAAAAVTAALALSSCGNNAQPDLSKTQVSDAAYSYSSIGDTKAQTESIASDLNAADNNSALSAAAQSDKTASLSASAASEIKNKNKNKGGNKAGKNTGKSVRSKAADKNNKSDNADKGGGDKSGASLSQNAQDSDSKTVTVTVSVDCVTAFEAGNRVAAAVSENGIMLSDASFTLNTGASAFDALKAAESLHPTLLVASSKTAMGVYVYSIGSLAEKAQGGQSGWLYTVNGEVYSKSCDSYILKNGDKVCFIYTCDGGEDIKR